MRIVVMRRMAGTATRGARERQLTLCRCSEQSGPTRRIFGRPDGGGRVGGKRSVSSRRAPAALEPAG